MEWKWERSLKRRMEVEVEYIYRTVYVVYNRNEREYREYKMEMEED